MKKTVIWCGPDRIIPGIGIGSKGARLDLPPDTADSFIKQGLAKLPATKQNQLKEGK